MLKAQEGYIPVHAIPINRRQSNNQLAASPDYFEQQLDNMSFLKINAHLHHF